MDKLTIFDRMRARKHLSGKNVDVSFPSATDSQLILTIERLAPGEARHVYRAALNELIEMRQQKNGNVSDDDVEDTRLKILARHIKAWRYPDGVAGAPPVCTPEAALEFVQYLTPIEADSLVSSYQRACEAEEEETGKKLQQSS